MLLVALLCGTVVTAQVNSFAEKFQYDANKQSVAASIPSLRISGIGSLTQVSDSADNGASANIMAEFNFLDVKTKRSSPAPYDLNKLLKFYMNFNINATLETTQRDSIRLSDIFFQDKSKVGFAMGLSTDLMRLGTAKKDWKYSMDKVHSLDANDKFDYFRLEPVIEYSYARWNLRSTTILPSTDSLTMPDTIPISDRIQTSQLNVGLRLWYTLHSGNNTFGFLIYPHLRAQTVTDATMPVFENLFAQQATTEVVPQSLTFFGLTAGLQINKVQFTFTYNELLQQVLINDRDVSGGVFQLKVSVISDFLDF